MSAHNVITLPPKNREREIERIVMLCNTFQAGKAVNVKFTIARPERTPPQLRYLWGVAYEMLSDAAGYEKQDIHEYLCMAFFGKKVKKLPGNRLEEIPIRTTTEDEDGQRDVIDGEAFWRFVEFVQRFAARHGVIVPDPEKDICGKTKNTV